MTNKGNPENNERDDNKKNDHTYRNFFLGLSAPGIVVFLVLIAIGIPLWIFGLSGTFKTDILDGDVFNIDNSLLLSSGLFLYCGTIVAAILLRGDVRKTASDFEEQIKDQSRTIKKLEEYVTDKVVSMKNDYVRAGEDAMNIRKDMEKLVKQFTDIQKQLDQKGSKRKRGR